MHGVVGMGTGAASDIMHGSIPGAAIRDAEKAYAGYGLHSIGQYVAPELTQKIEDKLGYKVPTDEEWAARTAPISDAVEHFKGYGSVAGVKKALSNAPVSTGLDALSVIDPAIRVAMPAEGAAVAARAAARRTTPATAAEVGEALRSRAAGASAGVDAAYQDMRTNPGVLSDRQATAQMLWQNAVSGLHSGEGFPGRESFYADPQYAATHDAMRSLAAQVRLIAEGNDPVNLNRLESVRRGLRFHSDGSTNGHHIGNLIDGFDEGLRQAVNVPGNVAVPGGTAAEHAAAAASAVRDMESARQAYVHNLNTFGSNAPSHVRRAVAALGDDFTGDAHQAGSILSTGLQNDTAGLALHQHLSNIGMEPVVNSHLRGQLLEGTPRSVSDNLNGPLAERVFTPEEITYAHELNRAQGPSSWGKAALTGIRTGARVGAAYLGAHSGPVGAAAASLAEQAAENVGTRIFHPTPGPLQQRFNGPRRDPLTAVARGIPTAATTTDLIKHAGEAEYPGANRSPHARGGKVGHQHLVDRLMRGVEQAKKAEQERTSAILHQPDEAVAKALNMAQAAI